MRVEAKTLVKVFFITFLVIGGLLYGLFQARGMIRGPVVDVSYPENGSTIVSPLVEVVGTAENIAYITLNGQQIYTNEFGEFREKLIAAPGQNTLVVAVKDKFNRTEEERIELYYKQPEELPSAGVVTEADTDVVYQ